MDPELSAVCAEWVAMGFQVETESVKEGVGPGSIAMGVKMGVQSPARWMVVV